MNDVEQFRGRVQAWLNERFDPIDPDRDDDRGDIISRAPDGHQTLINNAVKMQQDLYDAGFIGLATPVEYGGHGLARELDAVVAEELALVDAPSIRLLGIGLGLALPTIKAVGTEAQKQRYIPKLLSAREVWCQLFSEPDAGSDLVSLRCRGVADGESWVVTGQKVWSSIAADAHFGLLLARTDPTAEKPHAGITMFILDMHAPGVAVRPLVDIAGGHHFNEVFLEDVVISSADVLGDVNRGWQVANGTLSGERSNYLGGAGGGRRRRQAERALVAANRLQDLVQRQRVVDITARELMLEWLSARIGAGAVFGNNPAVGSLIKVAAGNLEQDAANLVMDLLGVAGVAWDVSDRDGDIASHTLNAARQATIAGGTHQIQRNLLGERVLGLPRER